MKRPLQHLLTIPLVVCGLLSVVPAQAGLKDYLESAKISQKVKDEVAKLKAETTVDLVEATLFEGINTAFRYKYRVEPNGNMYPRTDTYVLSTDLTPGSFLKEFDLPVDLNIQHGTEVVFVRPFKSQGEALKAIPYTLGHLPMTADRAIKKMKTGDFVAFNAKMNIVLTAGMSSMINSLLKASASTYALVSGEFQVHVYKTDDSKVRVKLIAVRSKGAGASATVRAEPFSITGIKVIDGRIRQITGLKKNLFEMSVNASSAHLMLVDYLFNLTNKDAAAAYNHLMGSRVKFKDVEMLNPINMELRHADKLVTNLEDVQAIFDTDRDLKPENRRIDRVFMGQSEATNVGNSFRFGMNLLRIEKDRSFLLNRMESVDRDDRKQFHLMDSFTFNDVSKFLFRFLGEAHRVSVNMLFNTDENFSIKRDGFVTLVMSRERTTQSLTSREQKEIKKDLRRLLPPEKYAQIDWKGFANEKYRVNSVLRNHLIFNMEAMDRMPARSYQEIYRLYRAYLAAHPQPKGVESTQTTVPGDGAFTPRTWVDALEADIQMISLRLTNALNTNFTPDQRHAEFIALKDYPIFVETGGGFLMSLLPQKNIEDLVTYRMTWEAKDTEPVKYSFGKNQEDPVYNAALYVQGVLNNRSADLSLQREANGEYRPQ